MRAPHPGAHPQWQWSTLLAPTPMWPLYMELRLGSRHHHGATPQARPWPLMNAHNADVKSRVVGERQRAAESGKERRRWAEHILPIPTYSFLTAVTSLRRQTQGNHGSQNTVALVKNGKEGSVFSGSKDRAGIRHPHPGSSYTYLGQKGI